MIAVQRTTTIRAGVPAHGESFRNGLATLRTHLRRSSRVHFHHDTPGACSLGDQDAQEEAPSGVGDRFGKGMVPYHAPNVQLLNRNMVILVHEYAGGFVGKVPSCSFDFQVCFGKQCTRFAAAMCVPSDSVAKDSTPTSMPTALPMDGSSDGATAHAILAYQPSALRTMVQVLGVPSSGRSLCSRIAPILERMSRPLSSVTPLPHCG